MSSVISVENLSKKYIIGHQKQAGYTNLREVLADGAKRFTHKLTHPFAAPVNDPTHEEFWALKDVSFEIKKGETVGIIGRNGSGKSTLLQIIAGTLTPTSGSVKVDGRVAALLELGSGFNPEFTGRENVLMNASILGLSAAEIRDRFDEIAAFAQIGDFLEQPVKTYSSGMLMRLAFSVAISVQPEVLIVDEALSVGDMAFQFKCTQRLEQMAHAGVTILFVSHSIGMVRSMCDHVLYLRNGKIHSQGDTDEVIENYLLDLREDQRRDAGSPHALKPKQLLRGASQAFGTDQGRILAASFSGLTDSLLVQHGDEVSIIVELEFDETLLRPEIVVLIQDRRSVAVTGAYAALTPKRSDENITRRYAEFRFPATFVPGRWFITLALIDVLDEGLKLPIDKQVAVLTLEVSSSRDVEHIGMVDIGIQAREFANSSV